MNSSGAPKKNSIKISTLLPFLLIPVLVVAGIYLFQYYSLHYDYIQPTPFSPPDSLEIPMRPGVQGIVISGPEIKDLLFEIDMTAAGIQPIVWEELKKMVQTAQIIVQARVSPSGDLQFNYNSDVKDLGYPDAGQYIANRISTWKYKNTKTGPIRFKFDIGAVGHQLTVDPGSLQKKSGIAEKIMVKDGTLYYIPGLKNNQVSFNRVDF
ncbi:hypothetical protein JW998_09575 [candidate division KSB1 bacterium]|nr:hypothetical protein [candidate division KSB1 bacterium]